MKEKKNYLSPSMEVVEIECQGMLMASSTVDVELKKGTIDDAILNGDF